MCYSFKKLTQVFQRPYPINTRANLENLGTVLFLRARGIQKSAENPFIVVVLMFSFETCVRLRIVEDCKFSEFY